MEAMEVLEDIVDMVEVMVDMKAIIIKTITKNPRVTQTMVEIINIQED